MLPIWMPVVLVRANFDEHYFAVFFFFFNFGVIFFFPFFFFSPLSFPEDIPPELARLPRLQMLHLANNKLAGMCCRYHYENVFRSYHSWKCWIEEVYRSIYFADEVEGTNRMVDMSMFKMWNIHQTTCCIKMTKRETLAVRTVETEV